MEETGKEIPISAAKEIAKKFGYTQVAICAYDANTGKQHVTTYGTTKSECSDAARLGNQIKRKVMGWPPELCKAKPDLKNKPD